MELIAATVEHRRLDWSYAGARVREGKRVSAWIALLVHNVRSVQKRSAKLK
jgi:hypothetical protein